MILNPSDKRNLTGQDTGRNTLSASAISTLLACPKKYEYHYLDRLELISKPRPLGMGSAFHHALEHRDPNAGETLLRWQTTVDTQQAQDRLDIECATVRAAAQAYLRNWETSAQEQREVDYRVQLRNPATGAYSRTFDLVGRADGVTDHGSHLQLTEDKFVGQITALTVRRLPLDRQVSLACYGLGARPASPSAKSPTATSANPASSNARTSPSTSSAPASNATTKTAPTSTSTSNASSEPTKTCS